MSNDRLINRLILIKHAMPEIEVAVPSRAWRLSPEGRADCEQLAAELAPYVPEVLVSSVEPKAAETGEIVAGLLNLPCRSIPGLHENDRTGLPYLDDARYEAMFRRFFACTNEQVVGNETAHQAAGRFARAVDALLAVHPTETLGVVAHGTVISLYLQRIAGVDPFPLWRRLGLPSFVVLSRPSLAVEAIVERLPPR
jgi:broad specificity phosphatase PhoE